MTGEPDAGLVCVRPAWGPGSPPLSERAAALLVAEWRELGLLDDDVDDDADPQLVLRGVQQRAGGIAPRAAMAGSRPPLRLVTTSDAGPDTMPAPEADWPTFEGRLLTYGETALVGRDPAGRPVRERFRRGSLCMPETGMPVLVNRGHDRSRVVGHLTGLAEVGDEVHCRGLIVDTVEDGHDAVELAKAGSVRALSIEFLMGEPGTKITRDASGAQMVEHSSVMLLGVGLVPQPAYASARLTRLLDRAETSRQREHDRRHHVAALSALTAGG